MRPTPSYQPFFNGLLDEPGYRDSAQSLCAEIAARPGVEHAVALFEELVRTGEPPTRS